MLYHYEMSATIGFTVEAEDQKAADKSAKKVKKNIQSMVIETLSIPRGAQHFYITPDGDILDLVEVAPSASKKELPK